MLNLELVDAAKNLRIFTAPMVQQCRLMSLDGLWLMHRRYSRIIEVCLDDPDAYRVNMSDAYKISFLRQADVGHVEGTFTIENKVYFCNYYKKLI